MRQRAIAPCEPFYFDKRPHTLSEAHAIWERVLDWQGRRPARRRIRKSGAQRS